MAGWPDQEMVDVLDLRALFLDADGRGNDCLAADGIHVTAAGRAAWMEAVRAFLDANGG